MTCFATDWHCAARFCLPPDQPPAHTHLLVEVDVYAEAQHRLDLVGELHRVLHHVARADDGRVEEHRGEVLGRLVIGVIDDARAQLLDERVARVDLQRALLVLVVAVDKASTVVLQSLTRI